MGLHLNSNKTTAGAYCDYDGNGAKRMNSFWGDIMIWGEAWGCSNPIASGVSGNITWQLCPGGALFIKGALLKF